ncbi:MAG: hypothetical protein IKC80_02055 [Kiritimatiellae bacterium]|nr:hypothetical protein [Kiritimatiellia bacterium]
MTTKKSFAFLLAGLLSFSRAAASGEIVLGDFTTERFKYSKLHLQGIACDETGIYYGFADGVTKTDWTGRVLAQGASVYGSSGHIGDVCLHNGLLYATSWRTKPGTAKPGGAPGSENSGREGLIQVFNAADLAMVPEKNRVLPYSTDGIEFYNGAFWIGLPYSGPYPHTNMTIAVWNEDFTEELSRPVHYSDGTKLLYTMQTLAEMDGLLWHGCYVDENWYRARKLPVPANRTYLTDKMGNIVYATSVWTATGIAMVPESLSRGRRLIITAGDAKSGGARVDVRFWEWLNGELVPYRPVNSFSGASDLFFLCESSAYGLTRDDEWQLGLKYRVGRPETICSTLADSMRCVRNGCLDGFAARTVALAAGAADVSDVAHDALVARMEDLVRLVRAKQPSANILLASVAANDDIRGARRLNRRLYALAKKHGADFIDCVPDELFAYCESRSRIRYGRWLNSYHDAIVYKIGLKGKHLKKPYTTMDEAMGIISKVRDYSGGMRQIVYLCGWQFDGHDSKYPSWSQVGEHVDYAEEKTPLLALRRFIRDARSLGADVSLHVNMNDAYTNAPDWKAYADADAICRMKDGSLQPYQVFDGEQSYQINHEKEWNSGLARKRIDALLDMIPELLESKTIHIDAFFGDASPYHGLGYKDDMKWCDRIVDYWREKGMDVTTELLSDVDQIGYFPMVYHHNIDERHRVAVDQRVLCGGDGEWSVRNMNFYSFDDAWKARTPDAGVVYPEAWGEGHFADIRRHRMANDETFLSKLVRTTMLNAWYNKFRPVRHTVDAAVYRVEWTMDVLSEVRLSNRRLTVTQRGRTVVENGNYFLDYPDGKLVVYSTDGGRLTFMLPPLLQSERVFRGRTWPSGESVQADSEAGRLTLELRKGTAVVLFPEE